MFELSDTERQVLEELWKLIQTQHTTQNLLSGEVGSKPSSTLTQQLDDPPMVERIRVLHHKFSDNT
jgi:hypothetical protein